MTTNSSNHANKKTHSSSSHPLPPLPPQPNTIDPRTTISPTILSCIGQTPLVQLHAIPHTHNLPCTLLAKCEFLSAGGSIKDRIALRMICDAEARGEITPGRTTLIEPTSGNTGIGLALVSALRGYNCIIVLPEKMSAEKVNVLKALGAEIVRTPTEAAWDAPDSHISVAKRLQEELADSWILDQYRNESNPLAHYEGTAEEIWMQTGGKIDMLVAGAGTGGTISGIAKKLKEYNPNIQIIGVDPEGSILAQPESLNESHLNEPYQVEGIGYDFIPNVLDRSLIDEWYKSNDYDSLVMMRKLIREEGLLCGGSCGAAVSIAVQAAQSLREDQTCVVIMPDSVRNYMTKALEDDWMIDHEFVDGDVIRPREYHSWWAERRVCDIPLATPLTITSEVTCKAAIALLKREGFDMVPVIGKDGNVVGVVTEGNMTSKILSGQVKGEDSVKEAGVIYKTFRKFCLGDRLGELARALDHDPFALIVTEQRCFVRSSEVEENGHQSDVSVDLSLGGSIETKIVVSGIVTRIDLLDFITKGE